MRNLWALATALFVWLLVAPAMGQVLAKPEWEMVFRLGKTPTAAEAGTARLGLGVPESPRWAGIPHTLTAIADLSLGRNPTGDALPRTGTTTAARSGNTVTLSGGTVTLSSRDLGRLIIWPNGEYGQINTVISTTSATTIQSGTVSASTFSITAKGLVVATVGDSVSYPDWPAARTQLYYKYGFGGMWFSPSAGLVAGASYEEITLAGGATVTTDATTKGISGQIWDVPSGATVTVSAPNLYTAAGARAATINTLPAEAMLTDRFTVVWERQASAASFTVSRKRWSEPDSGWTVIDTVDANAGAVATLSKNYTHALAANWMYRITCSAGTKVRINGMLMANRTTPGLIFAPVGKGGDFVASMAQVGSQTLKCITDVFMPDLIVFEAKEQDQNDKNGGPGLASALATHQALWDAACPRTDWAYVGTFPSTNDDYIAETKVVRDFALGQGRAFLDTHELGVHAVAENGGWMEYVAPPTIHHSTKGGIVGGVFMLRKLGLLDWATGRNGGSVSGYEVRAERHIGRGDQDLQELAIAAQRNWRHSLSGIQLDSTGQAWSSGTAAPGTGAFTISLTVEVPAVPAAGRTNVRIASAQTNANVNKMFTLQLNNADGNLALLWRSTAPATNSLTISGLLTRYRGKTVQLVVRTDRTRSDFDVWVDGFPLNVTGQFTQVGSDALSTWDLDGTNFGVFGDNGGPAMVVHGLGYWNAALTDAQVADMALQGYATTTANLQNLYRFTEGQGNSTADASGNARTLSRTAGTQTWVNPRTNLMTATASLDFPSIAAAGSQELTITVAGAAVNDSVALGPPATFNAGLMVMGYVSAANTVTVRAVNPTASPVDPAAATWRASIQR